MSVAEGPVTDATGDAFAGVVGHEGVVAELRAAARAPVHAYLLVGPPGAGAGDAAAAFSAALLCPEGGCGHCRDCRLALAGEHPDAVTFVPQGASLSVRDDVPEIIRLGVRSPVEGRRKVLILTEFHRVLHAAPALLKTIEEPPPSTVFVILADTVTPDLVTIASRCIRIDVPPLPDDEVVAALVAEGADEAAATAAAGAAMGDVRRARLLLADAGLAARQRAWAEVPRMLDGSGAAVAVAVGELLGLVEEAAAPLRERQAEEVAALEERVARTGERGAGRKLMVDRHKRELRRHRAAELRFGLATVARRYRDDLVSERPAADARATAAGLDAIAAAGEALVLRNPNETLLLQALFLELPPLA